MASGTPGLANLCAEVRTMIFDHLFKQDLYHLMFVCISIKFDAERVLYRRDACHDGSYAILWAAKVNAKKKYQQSALATLELSLKYGGDVNALHFTYGNAFATALHVAAAYPSVEFVRRLIGAGADIYAFSYRMWSFLDVQDFDENESRGVFIPHRYLLRKFALMTGTAEHYWLTLLPAMFHKNFVMIECLTNAGCSPYLAIDPADASSFRQSLSAPLTLDRAYTMYHMAIENNCVTDFEQAILRKYQLAVSVFDPKRGLSVLMMAAEKGDMASVKFIPGLPQNVNLLSSEGLSALSYAVQGAFNHDETSQKKNCADIVKFLLNHNADPNAGHGTFPMTIVVDSHNTRSINFNKKLAKYVVDLLLEKGADVNVMIPYDCKLSEKLFFMMRQKKTDKCLEDLFFEFVRKKPHLANHYLQDGGSMLKTTIYEDPERPKIAKVLLENGAQFCPHEIDDIFSDWVLGTKNFPQNLDMSKYVDKVSADVIDDAFLATVQMRNERKYKWLRDHCQPHRVSEELVAAAIQLKCKFREDILSTTFDPDWTDDKGRTFAHLVLEGLEKGLYTHADAVKDMETLINKGTLLGEADNEGLTPHGRLKIIQENGLAMTRLETVMSRAQLKQDGYI